MIRRYLTALLIGALTILAAVGCGKDEVVQIERFLAEMSESGLPGQSKSAFVIPLTGEEAGVTTNASGTATLTILKASMDYRVELNGIATEARTVDIMLGEPGQAGTSVASLFDGIRPGPINGVLVTGTLLPENITNVSYSVMVDAIRAGQAYILVGTTAQPGGELRGQTGPRGYARFVLDGSTVSYVVEGFVISEVTSAGIYLGRFGMSGPQQVSLFQGGPTGMINGDIAAGEFASSDIDSLTLSQLIGKMRNGDAYVQVTTSAKPTGAMRGQVLLQF